MNQQRRFFIILAFVFGGSIGFAQQPPAPPANASPSGAVKTPKKQTLSFEDELVEGSAQKPELFYLLQKKNFNYKRLIRLRENFLPEMRETTEVVNRSGSGN